MSTYPDTNDESADMFLGDSIDDASSHRSQIATDRIEILSCACSRPGLHVACQKLFDPCFSGVESSTLLKYESMNAKKMRSNAFLPIAVATKKQRIPAGRMRIELQFSAMQRESHVGCNRLSLLCPTRAA